MNVSLPSRYEITGHAFRRTSATILANSGANMERIKRIGAWKSDKIAEGYVENSLAYKRETSDLIISSISNTKRRKYFTLYARNIFLLVSHLYVT